MKKILLFLLIFSLLPGICACGGAAPESSVPPAVSGVPVVETVAAEAVPEDAPLTAELFV